MNTRVEAAGPDAPAEQIEQIKAIHTKRHNAAVEELESTCRPLQRAGQGLSRPAKRRADRSLCRFHGPLYVKRP